MSGHTIPENVKIQVCKEYADGVSSSLLAQKYNIGQRTVIRYIHSAGIPVHSTGKPDPFTKNDVARICELYRLGISAGRIATLLNVSESTILRRIHKYEIPIRPPSERPGHRTYSFDHHYFDILNSPDKAYWVGFIIADGCIVGHNNSSRELSFCLHRKDKSHLQRFLQCISGNHTILEYEEYIYLHLYSNHLCDVLVQYHIVPRKSAIIQFPQMPPSLVSHFMRGYVDGDGCWYVPYKNRKYKGYEYPRFSITSKSQSFVKVFQENLIYYCNMNRNKICKDRIYHKLSYGGVRQLQRLIYFLYQDATLYLPRKWHKVQQILYYPVESPTDLPQYSQAKQLTLL